MPAESSRLLRLSTAELRLDVSPLGARVHRLRARGSDGAWRDVVLTLDRAEDHLTTEGFLGATVGRYANRIAGARLPLDGAEHRLVPSDGPHTLHGGPDGFDRRTWTVVAAEDRAAELELVSPDGDQGFPGEVVVRARFEVDGPELRTTYVATTDAPTVVSLSSHAYYRLGGTTVADHELTVHADHYLPVDALGIPTGEVAPVAGTRFDLRAGSAPGDLDQPYVVRGTGLREVARLRGHGLLLTLAADQPGLQVYTAGAFTGRPHPRHAGVALEPQLHPDSPHHPEWPSAVLRPGATYSWESVVRIVPDDR